MAEFLVAFIRTRLSLSLRCRFNWLSYIDVSKVLESLTKFHDVDVLCKQTRSHRQNRTVFVFEYTIVGRAHNTDQHVEKEQLREKSGSEEINPCQYHAFVACKAVRVILTKA